MPSAATWRATPERLDGATGWPCAEPVRRSRRLKIVNHTASTVTNVIYDLGDLSNWVNAGATLLAVMVALWIAVRDRRASRREAQQRWELDQLLVLAQAVAHGGIPEGSPAEVKEAEKIRAAQRMALYHALGGRARFPLGVRDPETDSEIKAVRDDPATPEYIKRQTEVFLEMRKAARELGE